MVAVPRHVPDRNDDWAVGAVGVASFPHADKNMRAVTGTTCATRRGHLLMRSSFRSGEGPLGSGLDEESVVVRIVTPNGHDLGDNPTAADTRQVDHQVDCQGNRFSNAAMR